MIQAVLFDLGDTLLHFETADREKLLHAIFGRAGEDVKNDSLNVPPGVDGIVINTKKFSRKVNISDEEREDEETDQSEAHSICLLWLCVVVHGCSIGRSCEQVVNAACVRDGCAFVAIAAVRNRLATPIQPR